jgi:hypothetical protein
MQSNRRHMRLSLRQSERSPVFSESGFLLGFALTLVGAAPFIFAAMLNLNPVTFFVTRPIVGVGGLGVFALLGVWLCLAVGVGIGAVCIVERRIRWSIVVTLLLLILFIVAYAHESSKAAAQECLRNFNSRVQHRCGS